MVSELSKEMIFFHSTLISRRYKSVIIGVFVGGLIAHGMAMFNHLYFHDDIAQFYGIDRGLIASGRWFLSLLSIFEKKIFCSYNYVLPLVNTLLSLVFLCLFVCLFVCAFNITNKKLIFLLGVLCSAFPTMAGYFGYLSTTPYYIFSLVLAIGGGLYCSRGRYMVGILLMALSISIYQAYIPFILSFFVFCIINDILSNPDISPKEIKKNVFYYITCALSPVFVYFLTLKVSLVVTNISLTSYKGANQWSTNFCDYLSRIPLAYKTFFDVDMGLFPLWIKVLFYLSLLFLVCRIVFFVFQKNKRNALVLASLFCFLPVTIGFIYIMCPAEIIGPLMLYSSTLIFFLFVWLLDMQLKLCNDRGFKFIKYFGLFSCCVYIFAFVKYDNICYMKASINQQRAFSYFTTLITRIRSVSGYSADKKICYINQFNIDDPTVKGRPYQYLEHYNIPPYFDIDDYLNDYVWRDYMCFWCGFNHELADEKKFAHLSTDESMPAYPDDGSIQIVDDTIIVKLGKDNSQSYQ